MSQTDSSSPLDSLNKSHQDPQLGPGALIKDSSLGAQESQDLELEDQESEGPFDAIKLKCSKRPSDSWSCA